MRDYSLCLRDILDAFSSIERFVEGMNYDDFIKDDKTSSAVIRKFEVIGEATKNIPDSIRTQYPAVPWQEMAGMRDRLIPFYFGVEYRLIKIHSICFAYFIVQSLFSLKFATPGYRILR